MKLSPNSVLLKYMLAFCALLTILLVIWQLPKQGVRWPLSRDHTAGSS